MVLLDSDMNMNYYVSQVFTLMEKDVRHTKVMCLMKMKQCSVYLLGTCYDQYRERNL